MDLKIRIAICILVLTGMASAQATWERRWDIWGVGDLYSVHFIDNKTGFAGSDFGRIYRTLNGGESWEVLKSENIEANIITKIRFTADDTGYAFGTVKAVQKTVDGGKTWSEQSLKLPGYQGPAQDIQFFHSDTVYGLALNSIFFKTTDGGKFWQARHLASTSISSSIRFRALAFSDSRHGFLVGDEGSVLQTQDGGETWDSTNVGMSVRFNSVHFEGDSTIVILGDGENLVKSTDGGRSWAVGTHTNLMGWFNAKLIAPKTIIATVQNFALFSSEDGGLTWTRRTPETLRIDDVSFPDPLNGFAVGIGGYCLRTTDGGRTWNKISRINHDGIYAYSFIDDKIGYGVGYDGATKRAQMIKTMDGGRNWSNIPAPQTPSLQLNQVEFFDQDNGIVYEQGGMLDVHNQLIHPAFYRTSDGGTTWNTADLPSVVIRKMVFPDKSMGWIELADGKGVLRSADGGVHWKSVIAESDFVGAKFLTVLDGRRAYVSGPENTILKTRDGGETWDRIQAELNFNLKDIQCVAEDTCFALEGRSLNSSHPPNIFRTDDGWSHSREILLNHRIMDIHWIKFVSAEVGFAETNGDGTANAYFLAYSPANPGDHWYSDSHMFKWIKCSGISSCFASDGRSAYFCDFGKNPNHVFPRVNREAGGKRVPVIWNSKLFFNTWGLPVDVLGRPPEP